MGGNHQRASDFQGPASSSQLAEDLYPLVTVPFYDRPRVMRLRRLSANQVKAAIGNTTLNWGEEDPGAGQHKEAVEDAVTILDLMDKAAQAVMVDPTYEEVVAEIDAVRPEGARKKALAQIDEIRKNLENYSSEDDPEVIELQAKADKIRAMEAFPLPEDTYGFLFSFAVRADNVDMRAFSKADAVSAAALGERYKKRPSEIVGIDAGKCAFLAESYDRMATMELEEHRRIHREMKSRGHAGAIRRG